MLLRLEDFSFESSYVPLQNYLMEINENKIKKVWQEKWKVNKGEKGESNVLEKSNFIVYPDHLRRYGTLSNRNLSKKLKHTQTRFYETVGARSASVQRPNLFLSSVFVPSSSIIINRNIYPNSSKALLSLQAANQISLDVDGYMLNARKLINQQLNIPLNDLRIYNCNECYKDVQKGIITLCKSCAEKKNFSRKKLSCPSLEGFSNPSIMSSNDPYNLMRRNRLGIGDTDERCKIKREKKNGNVLPNHEFLDKTYQTKEKPIECKNKEEAEQWIREDNNARRKSILDCDVNVYDLNKNSCIDAKNSNESDEDYPVALTQLKIMRPKLNKVDVQKTTEAKQEKQNQKTSNETIKKSEIVLNGQRFNILNKSHSTTFSVQKHLSDDTKSKKSFNQHLISTESDFPKRPPRKQKNQGFKEIGLKYSKSKSKSSPNLSIKPILKKAIENENSSAVLDLFIKSENSSIFSESDSFSEKPLLETLNSNNKKRVQSTLKKKKQVQFKMNSAGESANNFCVPLTDSTEKAQKNYFSFENNSNVPREEITRTNLTYRSKSCEDLFFLNNDYISEYNNRKTIDDIGRRDVHTEDNFLKNSKLKKSLSDRHLPFAPAMNKDDPLKKCRNSSYLYSSLFYDTMALRARFLRADSRKIIKLEKNNSINFPYEMINKPEKRTTDKNNGNIITYEEFKKISKESIFDKTNYSSSDFKKINNAFNRSKKLNFSKEPLKNMKIKPLAPSPPSRQITKSKNDEISLNFLNEEKQNKVSEIQCSLKMKEKETIHEKALTQGIFTTKYEKKTVNDKMVLNFHNSESKNLENYFPNKENSCSVTIHSTNNVDSIEKLSNKQTFHVFNKLHLNDINKVTISVRNENELTDDSFNSSTCTIIETGSNSAVIPIVSTNNKTTLIVGSTANISYTDVEPSLPLVKNENNLKTEKPTQYFFNKNFSKEEEEKEKLIDIGNMDPVEAVRRNLIPHICGKENNNLTLMKKIKESREAKERTNRKTSSQIIINTYDANEKSAVSSNSVALNFQNDKIVLQQYCKKEQRLEEDLPSIASSSFCSTLNSSAKNSSTDTSRSNSFRSNHYSYVEDNFDKNQVSFLSNNQFYLFPNLVDVSGQEKDKLECEYEIRNGLVNNRKIDLENVYEVSKDEFDQDQKKENTEKSLKESGNLLSDSLILSPILNKMENHTANKSIFEGASKYEILNYLVDAKERVQEDSYLKENSIAEDTESNKRLNFVEDKKILNEEIKQMSPSSKDISDTLKFSQTDFSKSVHHSKYYNEDHSPESVPFEKEFFKSTTEIERKDSGVGSETSNISRSKWQASSGTKENLEHLCEDCDQIVETQITNSGVMYVPMICRKCSKRRSERKEIIQEIVETEEKYGRDLKIVLEEFCKPMLVAGLLTPDQLSAIFLNTEELLENSKAFTEKLKDTLEVALEQGDEDFLTVNMGKLFLELGPMLHAFESYCTRQGAAAILLANLEKEKELLKIFLRVSQMENAILRRMNLNSFLMVPVQRVTKYPLLLARLYKVTPSHHEGRELLREAQRNIEIHLEHMNSETRDISANKVWRRFSTSSMNPRKSVAELELNNIKLRKMAIDVLEWNHDEVRFVVEGKLLYTQPTENNWKKGKTIKLTPIFALLVTLGKPNSKYKIYPGEQELTFPSETGIREATILLMKEKCGRYSLLREPLHLDKMIVCCESDTDDYFEIQELSTKDSFILKSDDSEKTKEWYTQLQYHAQILGAWRKRRNALANIMINGMMARVSLN